MVVAVVAAVTVRPLTGEEFTSAAEDSPFIELFNGHDLGGWVAEGAAFYKSGEKNIPVWSVQDGQLVCAGKGYGFLRFDRKFNDFELRLQYKIDRKCNSGVGIRHVKYTGARATRPSFSGYEIQILDDAKKSPDAHSTGALYRYVAPMQNAGKPAGQWNEMVVECRGPRIRVTLNDCLIHDLDQTDDDAIASKPLSGYVSVQNHGGRIVFRSIRVKELPPAP